jgi:hypothetical protein
MSFSSDSTARLSEAIALARNGQREAARSRLLELTAEQPNMELAWMWLASVTDDGPQRIAALRRVLELNPANEKARTALIRLTGNQEVIAPAPDQAPASESTPVLTAPPPARSAVETGLIIAAILIAAVVIVLLGANIAGGRLFAQPTPTFTPTLTFTATDTPLVSLTPTITPGGPTWTPYALPTLPPTWTPGLTDTALPTYTPLPTLTPLPTETGLPSATPSPAPINLTSGPSATPTLLPTLPPLATIAQVTAVTAAATLVPSPATPPGA